MLVYKTNTIEIVGGACRLREVQVSFTYGHFDPRFQVSSLTGSKRDNLFTKLNWNCATHFSRYDEDSGQILYYNPLIDHGISINIIPSDDTPNPTCDMAILALMAMSATTTFDLMDTVFCGELGLDGDWVPLKTPLAVGQLAKQNNLTIFAPAESARMVAMTGADTVPVDNAFNLWYALGLKKPVLHEIGRPESPPYELPAYDLVNVKARQHEAYALEVAVAGGHNILFTGPPGQGKSLLAKCIPSIAPALSWDEVIEVSAIYQQAARTDGIITQRQVRIVDPSVTKAALIGGGSESPMPGEVSLAHRGVLLLDEFPQAAKSVIEALRGPLQDGVVFLSRAAWKIEFPANFMLASTCNPCPCGYYGSPSRECICTRGERTRYVKKLSGPILDRIPIRIWTPPLSMKDMMDGENCEASAKVAERVALAREMQRERGVVSNDSIEPQDCEPELLGLDTKAEDMLMYLSDTLSPRSYHNLLRVSRTVADIRGSGVVTGDDLERAMSLMIVDQIPLIQ